MPEAGEGGYSDSPRRGGKIPHGGRILSAPTDRNVRFPRFWGETFVQYRRGGYQPPGGEMNDIPTPPRRGGGMAHSGRPKDAPTMGTRDFFILGEPSSYTIGAAIGRPACAAALFVVKWPQKARGDNHG